MAFLPARARPTVAGVLGRALVLLCGLVVGLLLGLLVLVFYAFNDPDGGWSWGVPVVASLLVLFVGVLPTVTFLSMFPMAKVVALVGCAVLSLAVVGPYLWAVSH